MRSAFFRQMALITVLVFLILTILGAVYYLSMTNYLIHQHEKTLSANAQAVATLSQAYGSVGDLASSWDFRMSFSLAAQVADTDAVICDESGTVVVCACQDFSCAHLGRQVSSDYMSDVLASNGQYFMGKLSGLYDDVRYLQALPLYAPSGDHLGIVIVSTPTADLSGYLLKVFLRFVYTALAVWLVAILATFIISRHEAGPMKRLTQTVRRFGHGDLTVRAVPGRKNTAEMAELISAFNNMADSLEQSDRIRSEFIANISHELKTPMTSIAGYLDGMLDGTIPPQQHRHYMQLVTDEVRRLSRMVRSMLEISRMQADGIGEDSKTRFDLGETVGRTLLTFEQKIKQRHLEVSVELPEKPLYVKAHPDSITQVIYNLVDNAVKFANDCGYLTISVRQEGNKAHVMVKNTGPIIPAAELPLIFDRFHKLDKSRSKDPNGVGLGLYIVKTILGAHNEEIWVESHDGETAFTFTLSVAK